MYVVGVRAPLDVLEERECSRDDRATGMAREQINHPAFGRDYDLIIDTSICTPMEGAAAIRRFIGEHGTYPPPMNTDPHQRRFGRRLGSVIGIVWASQLRRNAVAKRQPCSFRMPLPGNGLLLALAAELNARTLCPAAYLRFTTSRSWRKRATECNGSRTKRTTGQDPGPQRAQNRFVTKTSPTSASLVPPPLTAYDESMSMQKPVFLHPR
jgi:hypothetical protein